MQQEPEQNERRTREVEVKPVGQRELKRNEYSRGQGRELDGALLAREERGGDRDCDGGDEGGLHEAQVGDAFGMILAPTPERER